VCQTDHRVTGTPSTRRKARLNWTLLQRQSPAIITYTFPTPHLQLTRELYHVIYRRIAKRMWEELDNIRGRRGYTCALGGHHWFSHPNQVPASARSLSASSYVRPMRANPPPKRASMDTRQKRAFCSDAGAGSNGSSSAGESRQRKLELAEDVQEQMVYLRAR